MNEPNRTEFRMGGLYKDTLVPEDKVQEALARAIEAGRPFVAEPYPDGEWCLHLKVSE